MKVLFLTPSFLPRVGGVERHVAAVTRELTKKGYQVSIITSSPEKPAGWDLAQVICMPSFTGPLRLAKIWGWLWRHRQLWQQADLVHGHDFPSYYWAWPLRVLAPKPFYLTFHGWEGIVPPKRTTIFLRRWAERGARGTIAVGHFIAKWYGQRPNFVTYGGVDMLDHMAPQKKNPKSAVFIGQLREDTGVREYLAAYKKLWSDKKLDTLDIFGDGPLRGDLEASARQDKLPVTFHGVKSEPIKLFGQGRYAFVSGYLGMLEAMAAGSIVIANYTNALKEDYLKLSPFHTLIKEADSPAALATAIVSLQKQPALVTAMAAAGQEFAAKQTWQRVAETYEQLWLTQKLA